jgi:hypothetical protein
MSQILELAGFNLQVLGYEIAKPDNIWDADWLNVMCSCTAQGSRVKVSGAFVTIGELHQLLTIMKDLHSGAIKTGEVNCMEPELRLSFEVGGPGQVRFTVTLSPDHLRQSHRVTFDIERSTFTSAIDQCTKILAGYPARSITDAN